MKTQSILIVAIFLMCVFALMLTACDIFPSAVTSDVYDSVVRIHIRANSNDSVDQEIKLKVRDEITVYLGPLLENCKDKNQALEVITANISNIKQIADNTLYDNDFMYSSSVSVKKEYFEERQYDDYIFPEGVYDALIIELGTGTGDNWWCVAFPPLCFVPDSDGEKIVYKSWVKEILDKIFD